MFDLSAISRSLRDNCELLNTTVYVMHTDCKKGVGEDGGNIVWNKKGKKSASGRKA